MTITFCLIIHSVSFLNADYEYPETGPSDTPLSGSNACAVYTLSASGSIVYVSVRSADYSNWSFNGYLHDSADGATSLSFNQNYYSDTIGLSRYGYRHLYLYGTITDTDTNQNCTIDSEGGINITHYY
jgi:hypothetical protein